LSSPFDLESIDLLVEIGIDIFKIPSGEITNYPYLEKIGTLKKKVILSTGMSYLSEVKNALDILIRCGTEPKNIFVLHCNSEYPSPFKDVNLNAMLAMKNKFGVEVGYSDHTLGIEVPIAAVALGAVVIEKHFTLDKNMSGPDHIASLDPIELKQMVMSIRNVEKCFGSGIKEPSESEKKNIISGRKSIVASENIKKGEVLSQNNLAVKRPGNGISPMEWYNLLGKIAVKDFNKDELIQL
jgi:N,N'-diacetyllegionaminate synthase